LRRGPGAGFRLGLVAALLLAAARVEARDMASILIDADSGVVLSALDATQPWHPASLTKMMTVYMAFGALADGKLTLDEELTVSETAAAQPETRIGLTAGKTISVEQAIKAVIVRSGNDAAVLLAERLAGSEAAFAAAMTNRALGLGMTRTKFVNASGLPDDGQITTARDMAILARHIIQDYPQYYGYFGSTSIVWRGRTLGTYNPLLGGFQGADGLKTGFTCASGYNIVGSAVRDGRRLIGVVLGGRSGGERNAQVTKLLEQGFNGLEPAPDAPVVELMESAADVQPPPRQLSSAECSTVPSVAGPTRFEGWAVIFGYFPSKTAAQKAIQTARTQLKPVMSRGQPAVIQRQQEGSFGFAALLVGLKKEDAGTACKQLWGAGGYCMALNPDVLNNPTALWR
jgi:D-alanyl-D-alanine carboxypeptidase